MIWQNQSNPLLVGQPPLDERQIQILVTSVNLVANDRMADVRKVDPDLMFTAGARPNTQPGEQTGQGVGPSAANKSLLYKDFGPGRRTIRPNTIFDRDFARL